MPHPGLEGDLRVQHQPEPGADADPHGDAHHCGLAVKVPVECRVPSVEDALPCPLDDPALDAKRLGLRHPLGKKGRLAKQPCKRKVVEGVEELRGKGASHLCQPCRGVALSPRGQETVAHVLIRQLRADLRLCHRHALVPLEARTGVALLELILFNEPSVVLRCAAPLPGGDIGSVIEAPCKRCPEDGGVRRLHDLCDLYHREGSAVLDETSGESHWSRFL